MHLPVFVSVYFQSLSICCIYYTLHTMIRYPKFSANSSLIITLLVQKCSFMPVKLFYCCNFQRFKDSAKEIGITVLHVFVTGLINSLC